jgi:hypothetical protein
MSSYFKVLEAFDEDVVQRPVNAIHADLDLFPDHTGDESIRNKLAILVCIEDCRNTAFRYCLFQGSNAEF